MFYFIVRFKYIFGLFDFELIFGLVYIYMNIIDVFWILNDFYFFNNIIVLEIRFIVIIEKCILNYFIYNCYLLFEESIMVFLVFLFLNIF